MMSSYFKAFIAYYEYLLNLCIFMYNVLYIVFHVFLWMSYCLYHLRKVIYATAYIKNLMHNWKECKMKIRISFLFALWQTADTAKTSLNSKIQNINRRYIAGKVNKFHEICMIYYIYSYKTKYTKPEKTRLFPSSSSFRFNIRSKIWSWSLTIAPTNFARYNHFQGYSRNNYFLCSVAIILL